MGKTIDETDQTNVELQAEVREIKARLDKLEHMQMEIHSKIAIVTNDLENKIKQMGFLK
jgi:hypothetical protein